MLSYFVFQENESNHEILLNHLNIWLYFESHFLDNRSFREETNGTSLTHHDSKNHPFSVFVTNINFVLLKGDLISICRH